MKRLCILLLTIIICFSFVACSGKDGADGKDGSDVSIYEIYEAANEALIEAGQEPYDSILDFLKDYLGYTNDELDSATSLQTSINNSLLASVSIVCNFTYTYTSSSGGGFSGFGGNSSRTYTYSEVYVGSGVIVSVDQQNGDAYIVTNAHVIYDSDSSTTYCDDVYMFLYGQDVYGINYTATYTTVYSSLVYYTINPLTYGMKAEIVAASLSYDLALFKVTDSDVIKNNTVKAASFSNTDVVYVGEAVYAIGNPNGEGMSATSGIISKESEYIYYTQDTTRYYRVIRTDTAINGGNSGGGLFNSSGELIGIINAKTVDEEIDNMGYALPISNVKRVVESMIYYDDNDSTTIETGVNKQYFGICLLGDTLSTYIDDDGHACIRESVYISNISVSSQYQSYFRNNDVLTHFTITRGNDVIEDFDVDRVYIMHDAMLSARSGDTITFTIKRSGNEKTITLSASNVLSATQWETTSASLTSAVGYTI